MKQTCELIHGDGLEFLKKHVGLFIVTDSPKEITLPPIIRASRVYMIYGGHDYLVGIYNGARIGGEKHVEPYFDVLSSIRPTQICDPFMGTGTIGEAALMAGHNFIGVEVVKDRYDICVERLKEWLDPT